MVFYKLCFFLLFILPPLPFLYCLYMYLVCSPFYPLTLSMFFFCIYHCVFYLCTITFVFCPLHFSNCIHLIGFTLLYLPHCIYPTVFTPLYLPHCIHPNSVFPLLKFLPKTRMMWCMHCTLWMNNFTYDDSSHNCLT